MLNLSVKLYIPLKHGTLASLLCQNAGNRTKLVVPLKSLQVQNGPYRHTIQSKDVEYCRQAHPLQESHSIYQLLHQSKEDTKRIKTEVP